MYCKLCGNTEGGTASHTAKARGEKGHDFTPFTWPEELRAIRIVEAVLNAAGSSSLRHYMPATRLKIISTTETALEA